MRPASWSTCAANLRRIRWRCRCSSDSASTSSAWRLRGWVRSAGGSVDWTLRPAAPIRRSGYSTSPLTQPASASSAAVASSPSALRRKTVPPVAPSASTARMLLALASFPSALSLSPTVSCDRKRSAVLTKVAAGRAWRATPAGSATFDSKLACTAGFLCGLRHFFERLPGRRHDRGCHGTLDEWSVYQPDVAVGLALKQVTHGEDGAAEVGEHDHALAAVGAGDRLSDRVSVGAELAVRTTAGGLDLDLGARDLGGEISQPACQFQAVRDQYNPDQLRHSPAGPNVPRNCVPEDGRSLHYRQEFSNAECFKGSQVVDPVHRPSHSHPQGAGERTSPAGRQRACRPPGIGSPDRARTPADASVARVRRAGPDLGQISARSGPAAARLLIPRPE